MLHRSRDGPAGGNHASSQVLVAAGLTPPPDGRPQGSQLRGKARTQ